MTLKKPVFSRGRRNPTLVDQMAYRKDFVFAMWEHDQGKMEKVHCMYGGRIDLLDYLTGNTEEQPLE